MGESKDSSHATKKQKDPHEDNVEALAKEMMVYFGLNGYSMTLSISLFLKSIRPRQ